MSEAWSYCARCGIPCRVHKDITHSIGEFRLTLGPLGRCVDCDAAHALAQSKKAIELINVPFNGLRIFRRPLVQALFASMISVSGSPARVEMFDWGWIADNWHLPFSEPSASLR